MTSRIGTILAGVILAVVGAVAGTIAAELLVWLGCTTYKFGAEHPWVPAISGLLTANFGLRSKK